MCFRDDARHSSRAWISAHLDFALSSAWSSPACARATSERACSFTRSAASSFWCRPRLSWTSFSVRLLQPPTVLRRRCAVAARCMWRQPSCRTLASCASWARSSCSPCFAYRTAAVSRTRAADAACNACLISSWRQRARSSASLWPCATASSRSSCSMAVRRHLERCSPHTESSSYVFWCLTSSSECSQRSRISSSPCRRRKLFSIV
mmetsp:Transcript_110478/g.312494  ORF Transcript_110478/g.312494 Transcript_110478/m.312494 type:complete len:207 (+) Transcript_110478:316-936(+)